MFSLFKKKEIKSLKPKTYGFIESFGIDGMVRTFRYDDISAYDEAITKREETIKQLKRAQVEKTQVDLGDGLVIDGAKLSWFFIDKVDED